MTWAERRIGQLDDAYEAMMAAARKRRGPPREAMLPAMIMIAAKALSDRSDGEGWRRAQLGAMGRDGRDPRSEAAAVLSERLPDAPGLLAPALGALEPDVAAAWVRILSPLVLDFQSAEALAFAEWYVQGVNRAMLVAEGHIQPPPAVSALMDALCDLGGADSVLVPYCGNGGLAAVAAIAAARRGRTSSVLAWEPEPRLAALARLAAVVLEGSGAKIEMVEEPLLHGDCFDAVFSAPPCGREADLAFFDLFGVARDPDGRRLHADTAVACLAAARLSGRGRAALMVTEGTLTRVASDDLLRRKLTAGGALASVVGLPKKLLFPATQVAATLMVFRTPPEGADGSILVADASSLSDAGRGAVVLARADVDAVLAAISPGARPLGDASPSVKVSKVAADGLSARLQFRAAPADVSAAPGEGPRAKIKRIKELEAEQRKLADEVDALILKLSDAMGGAP
jgi:hypothetical protein